MTKISGFQMDAVKLIELSYGVNESFDYAKFKDGIDIKPELEIEINKHSKENCALVSLRLEVFEKDSPSDPMWIQAQNQAIFTWQNDFQGDVDSLLGSLGASHLLSFLRPLVSQLTTMSLYPALILPLMDVSDIKEKPKKKKATTRKPK